MQTQKCSANCQIWRKKSDILVEPSYIEAAYIPCADLSRIYCVLRDTMIAYMSNIDLGMHAHFHFSANFNFAVLHRAQFWQHCYLYCIALSPAWRPRTFSEHFPFSHLSIRTHTHTHMHACTHAHTHAHGYTHAGMHTHVQPELSNIVYKSVQTFVESHSSLLWPRLNHACAPP